MSESRSVRTFTETIGSGPNAVTKTIVEETIIKADGSKITNRKETTTTGGTGASSQALEFGGSKKDGKEKDKKSGGIGSLFKKKDKKRSGSSSSDSSPERSENMKEFQENALKSHNELRKKHGVSSLKLSKDLCKYAQDWADNLAKSRAFQHSGCLLKGDKLGENIASKWSSAGADYTGKEVTEYWYSEIAKHKFGVEPSGSFGSGHFTQVIWKSSQELGIGKAKTPDGKCIVVGSYRPAGNLIGTFKENVPPPK